MRKFSKDYIFYSAVFLLVLFLWLDLACANATLRVYSSLQDNSKDFGQKFYNTAKNIKGIKYHKKGTEVYDYFWDVRKGSKVRQKSNLYLILSIEDIKSNLPEGAYVFNLGSGAHPIPPFNDFNIINFDAGFQDSNKIKWSAKKEAEKIGANFRKKQITDIKEKCSVAVWYNLPHFIRKYGEKTNVWNKTIGHLYDRKEDVLRICLEHTWNIIDDGGYFIITGRRYNKGNPEDIYNLTLKLNFDISEVHVIGKSINNAKAIILRKQVQPPNETGEKNNSITPYDKTELASGEGFEGFPEIIKLSNIFSREPFELRKDNAIDIYQLYIDGKLVEGSRFSFNELKGRVAALDFYVGGFMGLSYKHVSKSIGESILRELKKYSDSKGKDLFIGSTRNYSLIRLCHKISPQAKYILRGDTKYFQEVDWLKDCGEITISISDEEAWIWSGQFLLEDDTDEMIYKEKSCFPQGKDSFADEIIARNKNGKIEVNWKTPNVDRSIYFKVLLAVPVDHIEIPRSELVIPLKKSSTDL